MKNYCFATSRRNFINKIDYTNKPSLFTNLDSVISKDFEFVKGTGLFFLKYYKKIILKNQAKSWTEKNRKKLLLKRGRYVEFNLLYDKGTTFGLNTGGNTDAILMSMPPKVLWN